MTQFLGFARNFGGDFFVMTWLTGNDAEKFDKWQTDDEADDPTTVLMDVPAVVTKGMCPYTAKEGKWIMVTIKLNKTVADGFWSDTLNRMVSGKQKPVRTIRVTVTNDANYIPLFFQRNGSLWLSDPRPSNEPWREDTMILNMIQVADKESFPYTLQKRMSSYFPPIKVVRPIKADLPIRLPFKSREAEDVVTKRVTHRANKFPEVRRTKKTVPWPERKETNPHGLGHYSITIAAPLKHFINRPPTQASWFSVDEPRVKVISHVRPDPFSMESPRDQEEAANVERDTSPTMKLKRLDASFDNYQGTLPNFQEPTFEEESMDEDKMETSIKPSSFPSSSKSVTSSSVSDSFTPSPDGAVALTSAPDSTSVKPKSLIPRPRQPAPPPSSSPTRLLQILPATSTPNTSIEDTASSDSTMPLPTLSLEKKFIRPRVATFDTVPSSSTPRVTPGLLGLHPYQRHPQEVTPPLSPTSYKKMTLPLPGASGPDLAPSTSQECLKGARDPIEDSDSSTRNNPPSKIRFVPVNVDLFTSEIICSPSPTHDPSSPHYAEEIVVADFDPDNIEDENPQEEVDPYEEEEEKEVPHK